MQAPYRELPLSILVADDLDGASDHLQAIDRAPGDGVSQALQLHLRLGQRAAVVAAVKLTSSMCPCSGWV